MNELLEELTKAHHSANYTAGDLRVALQSANAVQGMALLKLIERAAVLSADIGLLLNAVRDDDAAATAKEATA